MATIQHLVGTNKIKDEWQKINANFDALNAENNGWRIYNDVTELGLTPGSETMEDICAALPSRSMLIYAKNASNTSPAYPGTIGVLIVTRVTGTRVALEFFSSSEGRPVKLVGFYNSGASPQFTGWAREALEYETGTWTPELRFGGASTGITYAIRSGIYTRIGNVVLWQFDIGLSSKGSATGDATIAGLPFTSQNARPYSNIQGSFGNLTLPTNVTGLLFHLPSNSSTIQLRRLGNALDPALTFDNSHFSDNTFLSASGKYYI